MYRNPSRPFHLAICPCLGSRLTTFSKYRAILFRDKKLSNAPGIVWVPVRPPRRSSPADSTFGACRALRPGTKLRPYASPPFHFINGAILPRPRVVQPIKIALGTEKKRDSLMQFTPQIASDADCFLCQPGPGTMDHLDRSESAGPSDQCPDSSTICS